MLIYDLEIIRMIPSKNDPKLPGYEYCGGWTDYENMGISVAGFMLSPGNFSGIWRSDQSDMQTLKSLFNSSLIVGFNSRNFDDHLLRANGIEVTTSYDVLEHIRVAAFGSPRWQDTPSGFTYSLGALGAANGFPKTGTGELAPKLWQEGRKNDVADYCRNDVKITYRLLMLGIKGELVDPNTGKFLKLPAPC